MQSAEPIVVTGMGVISPVGATLDDFHSALANGESGISTIEFPWPTSYNVVHAGRVTDFDFSQYAPNVTNMGLASQFAVASTRLALENGRLEMHSRNNRRIGIVVGTALGDATELESSWSSGRARSDNQQDVSQIRLADLVQHVAETNSLNGPSHLVTTTCAAGNHAIAQCCDILRTGVADAMIAAASDTVSYVGVLGFTRLMLQAPERCQPFDRHRKGTIISEGSGAILLETLSAATTRGATVLAEVAGYGLSCDAAGPFASRVDDTRGMRVAFNRALRMAGLSPDDIDHVSAHGSGTKLNDHKETKFLKEMFGSRAYDIPISGTKAVLGHAQGAASLFEAVASVLTLTRDVIYPTMNYETPDPKCDLDYVPNTARRMRVNTVLSNSFGMGGNNALVIFRRPIG